MAQKKRKIDQLYHEFWKTGHKMHDEVMIDDGDTVKSGDDGAVVATVADNRNCDGADGTGDGLQQHQQRGELVWEYELSRGRWVRYDKAINEKFNAKLSDGLVEFEMDESNLQVDFNTMKQKNLDTGFVRSVRCAVKSGDDEHRVWEYIDTKRRWRSVDPISAAKLENAYTVGSGNVKIVLSGTNFTADLESSLIRSEDGLNEYKLRSQISKAEPSMVSKPVPRVEHLRAAKRLASQVEISAPVSKRKVKQKRENDKEGDEAKLDKNRKDNDKKMDGKDNDDNEEDENDVDEEENSKPKKSRRERKKAHDKKDDEKDDEEEDSKPRKGRGRKKAKLSDQKTDDTNDTADDEDEEKIQMKKVVVKGVAAVDSECTDMVGITHVYTENKDIYDALLNQTNTQNNNNKYFIIQLLESDTEKQYFVWFRWGRVGYRGQTSLLACGGNLNQAKEMFCKKFKDKTKNDWAQRASFVKVAGKYDYLPADYSKVIDEQEKKSETEAGKKRKPSVESKLEPTLQELLKLICDVQAMEKTMLELEYDAKKAPLGQVTEKQIKAGYAALKEIEKYVKAKNFSVGFVEAVNNYYTKIPHFFGMRQPPLIKTIEQLKSEIKLLEALSEIGMAVRTFKKESQDDVHPIDRHYINMKCQLSILHADNAEYKLVDNYLQWTHAPTHSTFQMRIRNLFAVNRDGERERFMSDFGNRKLLWHGSRLTNWYGILSQGLRIAPPEAPVTGYMFGKGIYFADMASKSANYCYPEQGKPGLLVLAQVALGEMNELLNADYNADKLPAGKRSTKGLGSIGPDPATYITLGDGCEVPCGKPVTMLDKNKCSLNYNEYIVYDVKQVWIRYLIEVDFING